MYFFSTDISIIRAHLILINYRLVTHDNLQHQRRNQYGAVKPFFINKRKMAAKFCCRILHHQQFHIRRKSQNKVYYSAAITSILFIVVNLCERKFKQQQANISETMSLNCHRSDDCRTTPWQWHNQAPPCHMWLVWRKHTAVTFSFMYLIYYVVTINNIC